MPQMIGWLQQLSGLRKSTPIGEGRINLIAPREGAKITLRATSFFLRNFEYLERCVERGNIFTA